MIDKHHNFNRKSDQQGSTASKNNYRIAAAQLYFFYKNAFLGEI